jgi:hypothetical protein
MYKLVGSNVAAVIAFAAKFPDASLATIVDAPFEDDAVVAEFGIFVNEAPEPENAAAVMIPAEKFPDASLVTIADTVFADVAVVLPLANVPVVMLAAFSEDRFAPDPENAPDDR